MKHESVFKRLMVVCLSLLAVCLLTSGNIQAQQKEEILVGAVLSLTGPSSALTIDQKFAYELAVEDINKRNGIFVKAFGKKLPVKLVIEDDESDAGKAANAVERLIKIKKVDFILGTQIEPKNIAGAIVAEKYKVLYMSGTCTADSFLPRKFKWSTLIMPDAAGFGNPPFEILSTIPEAQRPKRIGLFLWDDPAGELFRKYFKGAAPKYGYSSTFPVDEPLPFGAKDYSSLIMKAKANKIDAILLLALTEDSITFVRQMKEAGFSVPYLHGWAGTWGIEFWKAMGNDAQYILADGFWHETLPYPNCKEMGEKFFKSHGKHSVSLGLWYASAQVLFEAIERAGTLDGAKVRNAIASHEFKNTPLGNLKYNESGYARIDSFAYQWWNGDQYLTYPFIKGVSHKVRLAPPWDKR